MERNLITAEGLDELRAELDQLETTGRDEIARQIKTAREWGDLKENAEYHAAKEAQAHLETRIKVLRDQLMNAEVVEATSGGDIVGFGSTVDVEEEASGKRSTYTLVAARESAPAQGMLSFESPMGTALRDRRVGDVAVVRTPRGDKRLKVLGVR
jgi:transcription elongation factor GreA